MNNVTESTLYQVVVASYQGLGLWKVHYHRKCHLVNPKTPESFTIELFNAFKHDKTFNPNNCTICLKQLSKTSSPE